MKGRLVVKRSVLDLLDLRPGSVDSLNGGSTDELKKAPVEKKIGQKLDKF